MLSGADSQCAETTTAVKQASFNDFSIVVAETYSPRRQ